MTVTQVEKRLVEAKKERQILDQEIETLRYLLSDLGGLSVRRDLRSRNKKIYRDWMTKKSKGKKNWIHELCDKYNLGPDRIREIYNQQKAFREKKIN